MPFLISPPLDIDKAGPVAQLCLAGKEQPNAKRLDAEDRGINVSDERRNGCDRRTRPTPPLSKYIFKGRRRQARRVCEEGNTYVDRYELRYLFIISAILVLCFADAYLTLTLMRFGGCELNPFMLALMNKDIVLALVAKYLITVFCLIFFLVHKNFMFMGRFRINTLIYGVLCVYSALVSLEFYWFFRVHQILSAVP